MARLFFHQPKFGILDECTSAVSVDVEKGLYEAAYKRGITCVTISQRVALEEFHSQELHLGADAASGYTIREIEKQNPEEPHAALEKVAGLETTVHKAAQNMAAANML